MPHYLIPDWPAPSQIKAYTTLRHDGHSAPPYNSFNLASHVGDDPKAVVANREQLIQELELKHQPAWLNQVHGITVVAAETTKGAAPDADASQTRVPEVACAVLTADCLPLLLCDEQGSQVAAIHAGWRGLLAGVIEATLENLHTPLEHWMAWLGPAIGPSAFKVGNEVREQFVAADPQATQAFQAIDPNAWYGNLYLLAKLRLAKYGVHRVYGGDLCTFSDASRFYSFRRDGVNTGRMASLIWIQT
jgi:YfiH family protein